MPHLFEEFSLGNPGVLITKLPDDIFEEIKAAIPAAVEAAVPYHHALVANIDDEFNIPLPQNFINFINMMWCAYRERWNVWWDREYNIPEFAWMNLMKKGEFNPVHIHDGVASWVLWVDIPYDLQEEIDAKNSKRREEYPTASMFEFVYNKLNGELSTLPIPIDKTWEGTMVMFPAYLKHQVYPFSTSNGRRISIASNIALV